jgi:hypothetical protein
MLSECYHHLEVRNMGFDATLDVFGYSKRLTPALGGDTLLLFFGVALFLISPSALRLMVLFDGVEFGKV